MAPFILAHANLRVSLPYIFLLLCFAVAWYSPRLGNRFVEPLERAGARLAAHRGSSVLFIALLVILVRVALLPRIPIPVPLIQDEFSYLLSGDTFAHGRLTNPPHPMWVFFETFHVNMLPTYMSKYPPAQGAFLAAGELLGHPWFGVLLSAAAMCAAGVWMLQGWLPARWALLGGILAIIRLCITSYWINSYAGGTVASIGGALVLGAFPRIVRFQRRRDFLLLALGLAVLANSPHSKGLFCRRQCSSFCSCGFAAGEVHRGVTRCRTSCCHSRARCSYARLSWVTTTGEAPGIRCCFLMQSTNTHISQCQLFSGKRCGPQSTI